MKIYTRKGDDGTTGLYGGGRVPKDSPAPEAYGTVDEAQAALGLARAAAPRGGELDQILVHLEADLWVLMAELATEPENSNKLVDGATRVTSAMVDALEVHIDDITGRFEAPTEFVVPGETELAARLDVARTVEPETGGARSHLLWAALAYSGRRDDLPGIGRPDDPARRKRRSRAMAAIDAALARAGHASVEEGR